MPMTGVNRHQMILPMTNDLVPRVNVEGSTLVV
jgi:hypothetical protein